MQEDNWPILQHIRDGDRTVGPFEVINPGDSQAERRRPSISGSDLREALLGRSTQDGIDPTPSLILTGIRVEGALDLYGARLAFGLRLVDCEFSSDVNLIEASIRSFGMLDCKVEGALLGDSVRIELLMSIQRTEVAANVRMLSCNIGSQLSFVDVAVLGSDGVASLALDSAIVGGDLVAHRLGAVDGVRLLRARIGGFVSFDGAEIGVDSSADRNALAFDGAVVGSDFSVADASVKGSLVGFSARIAGQLDLSRSSFGIVEGGYSVALDGASIAEDFRVVDSVLVGEMRAIATNIGGQIVFVRSRFSGAKAKLVPIDGGLGPLAPVAINLNGARVAQEFFFDQNQTDVGTIVFVNLQVGEFISNWDQGTIWRLRGLRYGGLRPADLKLPICIEKIKTDPDGHDPRSFELLARAMDQIGRGRDAVHIRISGEGNRRRISGWFTRVTRVVPWLITGYGFRLWPAAVWLVALVVIGGLVFASSTGDLSALLIRNTEPAGYWTDVSKANPLPYVPILYSVETVVPLLAFGQASTWVPITITSVVIVSLLRLVGAILLFFVVEGFVRRQRSRRSIDAI